MRLVRCLNCKIIWRRVPSVTVAEDGLLVLTPSQDICLICPNCRSNAFAYYEEESDD